MHYLHVCFYDEGNNSGDDREPERDFGKHVIHPPWPGYHRNGTNTNQTNHMWTTPFRYERKRLPTNHDKASSDMMR